MNTAELFSGTKSFSSVMTKHGHKTFTVDNDARLEPDLCIDIFEVDNSLYNCDMLWASPPCEGFSVAVIGRNWNHDNTPKTESARIGMRLLKKTIEIIEVSKPTWWFIENPRGKMRKMDFLQEFVKRQGGGTANNNLLSVRRFENEADRYLDECTLVEIKRAVQEWKFLSCISAARFSDRDARNQGSKRSRQNTRAAFRGDSRT